MMHLVIDAFSWQNMAGAFLPWGFSLHGTIMANENELQAGTTGEPSDHSLLGQYRRGNEDAATQIYARYACRLRALAQAQCSADLARREEVSDLVQSVFGSFFRGVKRGHYDVPAEEDLWKLFLVIALHKIRRKGNFHRRAKRDVRRTTGGHSFDVTLQTRPDALEQDSAFLQMVVDEALARLPPVQQEMVRLRLEGYEVAEIAERTQRSKRTVERLLQKCREQLADLLQGKD
jgi:RNA polymerase sigma-70 factor (ECF subfamily)